MGRVLKLQQTFEQVVTGSYAAISIKLPVQ